MERWIRMRIVVGRNDYPEVTADSCGLNHAFEFFCRDDSGNGAGAKRAVAGAVNVVMIDEALKPGKMVGTALGPRGSVFHDDATIDLNDAHLFELGSEASREFTLGGVQVVQGVAHD